MTVSSTVLNIVSHGSGKPAAPGVHVLANALLNRYGDSVQAILFYGSCLRRRNDDGLVDLYLLVDTYTACYDNTIQAFFNRWLPPNVFSLKVPLNDRVLRAKYSIITLRDFQRATSMRWFHSYFWGRFAQPTELLYARTDRIAVDVYHALAEAVGTLMIRTIPQMPRYFNARDLWSASLGLSYGAELRVERLESVNRLYDADPDWYDKVTRAVMETIPFPMAQHGNADRVLYEARISKLSYLRNRSGWILRRAQGKLLSILRLMKGLLTFDGGLDYIAWKIQRHSGVPVEITPHMRKHPLLAGLVASWRLYRSGAFR